MSSGIAALDMETDVVKLLAVAAEHVKGAHQRTASRHARHALECAIDDLQFAMMCAVSGEPTSNPEDLSEAEPMGSA